MRKNSREAPLLSELSAPMSAPALKIGLVVKAAFTVHQFLRGDGAYLRP